MIGSGPLGTVPFGSIPGATGGGVVPALILRVGGDDQIARYLKIFDYSIQKELNARDTFDCTFEIDDGWQPLIGQEVVLTWNGVRQFAGTINDLTDQFLSEGDALRRTVQMTCTDWNQILDRRTAVKAYENTYAGDIVRNLIATHLASEGITEGNIQNGLQLTRANWNHEPIATIMDELSKDVGFFWFVDYEKRLHFYAREHAAAPFTINEINSAVRGATVRRSRNEYRNTQIIKGWKEITNPLTERFTGDGETTTFPLSFPVYQPPTIRRNGQPQTVGIRGVETGKQWYWSKDQNEISQSQDNPGSSEADPKLGEVEVNEVLEVTYVGTYSGITYQQDTASVADRQTVEGGSGLYESVEVDASLEGGQVVITRGAGLLRRYGLDAQADFETEMEGLDIGQLITVDYPTLGLPNTEMLITSIELTQLTLDTRRYRFTCTTGEVKNSFKEFWMKFAQTGQKVGVREGEIVEYPVPLNDGLDLTDGLTATAGTAHAAEVDVDLLEFAEVG